MKFYDTTRRVVVRFGSGLAPRLADEGWIHSWTKDSDRDDAIVWFNWTAGTKSV